MSSPELARRARLLDAAATLGLPLDDAAAARLMDYLALLQRWNATYNLTAIRDPDQMLSQHLLDCLAAVGPLRRHFQTAPGRRVLDVGSGGGLPGAVIAMLCPDLDVTCVDAVGKKAAFITQAATHGHLANLHARHARVEQLREAPFDLITSRAFASLADFTALTRPLLTAGGVWMSMKGKLPTDEMAALAPDVSVFHVEQLTVPGLGAERCLVWMRPTPSL